MSYRRSLGSWAPACLAVFVIGCGASDEGGTAPPPMQPADPSAPPVNGPVDPANPMSPQVPTNPANPTDPTVPTNPTDPTNPAMPIDPTAPTNPVDPTDPVDPTNPVDPTGPLVPPDPGVVELTGCGLDTGWTGDEYCIAAPPPAEGFQVHYGPTDYDNPDDVAPFILQPGGETNINAPATSGNDTDVYFYKRQYRMRPGSHHMIVSESGGGIIGTGRRLGGSQNVAKDNPTGELPPENAGIGMPLSARTSMSINLHHFNGTTEPILREAWINFWYVDEASVTQEANEMFLWAQGAPVAPGERSVASGSHRISEAGRVLTMYGHRHSNAERFSAYRTRGGVRELVYEDYDWEEPEVLEFNSLTQNVPPNPATYVAGGHSGVLDLQPGDSLEWECEIQNNRTVTITFGENEAETSEMCILIGDSVGPKLSGFAF